MSTDRPRFTHPEIGLLPRGQGNNSPINPQGSSIIDITRVTKRELQPRPLCVSNGCGEDAHSRGLCVRCYRILRTSVMANKTTWAILEECGMSLKPTPRGHAQQPSDVEQEMVRRMTALGYDPKRLHIDMNRKAQKQRRRRRTYKKGSIKFPMLHRAPKELVDPGPPADPHVVIQEKLADLSIAPWEPEAPPEPPDQPTPSASPSAAAIQSAVVAATDDTQDLDAPLKLPWED